MNIRHLFVVALSCLALTHANVAYDIALEADRRYSGFGDSQANLTMTLISKKGQKDIRELKVMNFEDEATAGEKTLMVFRKPTDIEGTALLTWSTPGKDDEQWLYLPAIKRVKAISSRNKSGAFMGSEFTYEDLTPQDVEKYDYSYIGEETVNGVPCFAYDRTPKESNSGYTKQTFWVDQEEYRTQKIHFFDHKSRHTKVLTFAGYQQYEGRFWRPASMYMENLETGRATTLELSGYEFSIGLSADDFSQMVLKSQ